MAFSYTEVDGKSNEKTFMDEKRSNLSALRLLAPVAGRLGEFQEEES
jgi:hypothetical protein